MIKSMTGYGRAERQANGYRILAEIKAVNHRFAEVVVRMPRDYLLFEDSIKKTLLERVARGRFDVFLTVEKTEPAKRKVELDAALALELKQATDAMASHLGLPESLSLSDLLRLDGIMTVVENVDDPSELEGLVLGTVEEAALSFVEMRLREGGRLAAEFAERLVKMRQLVSEIAKRSPLVVAEYRERLTKRLSDAMNGQIVLDEARLLTEVALLADRASIDEELVRLQSHFDQFDATLSTSEPVGRKLDFLVQEMNREVNTIGSKANDLQISWLVVEAKSVLEQIREQVQNVE